jgi:hypothetical protein
MQIERLHVAVEDVPLAVVEDLRDAVVRTPRAARALRPTCFQSSAIIIGVAAAVL